MMPNYGLRPRGATMQSSIFQSDSFSRISDWVKKHPNILCLIVTGTFWTFVGYQASQVLASEKERCVIFRQESITLIPNHCKSRVEAAVKFNAIADHHSWGDVKGSKSGGGSNLEEAYVTAKHIDNFIQNQGIKSFADIPCGDMNWQGASKELNTIDVYFGADISESIIAENEMTFAQHHNKMFHEWDLVQCPVPQYQLFNQTQVQSFDMVMTRDVIQHLPLEDGLKFVQNVVLSPGIKYWAVSSFRTENRNVGAEGGHKAVYPNNLDIAPFNLPKENIVFSQRSHPVQSQENDLFVIYKIDENIKNVVQSYNV